MANWHYIARGQQAGPVTFDQLRAMAAAGQLQRTDNVWEQGTPAWVPASTVSSLFVPAVPPPPNAPAPQTASPTVSEDPVQTGRIIIKIILAAVGAICFCIPLFFIHVVQKVPEAVADPDAPSSANGVVFGWEVWFGLVALIVSVVCVASLIIELSVRQRMVRMIMRWASFALFAAVFITCLLGMILGIFGVGIKRPAFEIALNKVMDYAVQKHYVSRTQANAEIAAEQKSDEELEKFNQNASVWGIPIGSAVIVVASGLGAVLALNSALAKPRRG